MAEIVGSANINAVLENISATDFEQWQAYFKVRESESWDIASHVAAAAWNAAIVVSQASRECKEELLREPEAFIPRYKQVQEPPPPRPVVVQDMTQLSETLRQSFGTK